MCKPKDFINISAESLKKHARVKQSKISLMESEGWAVRNIAFH